jgi:hypothetical protein
VNWPFGRTRDARRAKKPPPQEKDIPRDDERRGPAPPPPRTAHAPGVSVYRFAELPSQHLLRLDTGSAGFFLEGEEGEGERRSAALLVLTGGGAASPGDVLVWTAASLAAPASPGEGSFSLSLEELCRTSPERGRHVRRDDLGGRAIPGITGLRALAQLPETGLAVLRLGPPPTARWAFRGVRAIAVFSGKITLVDGEEAKLVRAGSFAHVADPSATLYLEAGNDSALAVALAASGFVAALG